MTLCIERVGLITPVGLSARPTWAAIRAGVSRIQLLDHVYDRYGEPLVGARVPTVHASDPDERVTALILGALRDARRLPHAAASGPVFVALCLEDRIKRCPPGLVEQVRRAIREDLGSDEIDLVIFPKGNAGGLLALAEFEQRATRHPDSLGIILAGDSLAHRASIEYFEQAERLRDLRQVRGLTPGEAGACLIVRKATKRTSALARIDGIALGDESVHPGDDAPLLARGLTEVLRAVRSVTPRDPPVVLCDHNGEIFRCHEWALASIRVFDQVPVPEHPAECIGDVGAASAVLLIGLAACGGMRHHTGPQPLLVCCSSDSGLRAAAVVTPAPIV